MTGYNYTKRSADTLFSVTITTQKKSLFMAGYNYTAKKFTLCMTGYNYTKRSVHSLHDWLQLH